MLALKIKRQVGFLNLKKINQHLHNEIINRIAEVVQSGSYIRGQATQSFEKKFAAYIGCKYCIGVGNGLDALRLIIRGYIHLGKLKKGDSILVPHNTFIASVLAISEEGLKPILVPPMLDTYNLDTSQLENYIESNTTAIMPVHLYGMACYNEDLEEFIEKYNLMVIEDNAQSVGATYQGRKTGNFGDAAGVSFYPSKNLGALGDGGAVLTNDKDLADIVRILSNYGSEVKYYHKYKGLNSRLDEIQAAVLQVKLKYLDAHNTFRNIVAQRYFDGIKNPYIGLPTIGKFCGHVWHLFVIRTPYRKELRAYLNSHNVETLVHYPKTISSQPAFPELSDQYCARTTKLQSEILSLPMGPTIFLEDVEYVIELLNNFRP